MRSGWVSEPPALAYLTQKFGDATEARVVYLTAAQEGRLDVNGRREFMSSEPRLLIPREDLCRCRWVELPDPLSTGFHFPPSIRWYDREVRWEQLEVLHPRSPAQQAIAQRHAAICAAIDQGLRSETIKD